MAAKMTTLTFSPKHGVDLDVYVPASLPSEGRVPALIYFHGGFLINGSKSADVLFPTWLHDLCIAKGWLFICPNYRLLVPSRTADILEDMEALGRFMSEPGTFSQTLPKGVQIDLDRIASSGASAGAYVAYQYALTSGKPCRALLSIFGMGGNLLDGHWVDAHPSGIRFLGNRDEDASIVDAIELSVSRGHLSPVSDAPYIVLESGVVDSKERRGELVIRHLREGSYLDLLTGTDGVASTLRGVSKEQRVNHIPDEAKRFFPELQADKMPPTVFVHGDEDTAVPLEESEHHHGLLTKHDIETKLVVVKGGEHLFLNPATGAPVAGADVGCSEAFQFISDHMQ